MISDSYTAIKDLFFFFLFFSVFKLSSSQKNKSINIKNNNIKMFLEWFIIEWIIEWFLKDADNLALPSQE